MKDKNESCVELNIYVECDKCSKSEPIVSCPDDKHDDNESCVKINVFVECDDKKHRYTVWCYNLKWPPIFRRSFLSFINTKNYWFIKMRLNISWVNPYFSKNNYQKTIQPHNPYTVLYFKISECILVAVRHNTLFSFIISLLSLFFFVAYFFVYSKLLFVIWGIFFTKLRLCTW